MKKQLSQPTKFEMACYDVLSQVPRGKVTTYQLLAKAVGTKAPRAVGNAMGKNPFMPQVPCHRVVKSDGAIGGYAKGPKAKERILRREGLKIENGRVANFKGVLFVPRKISQR